MAESYLPTKEADLLAFALNFDDRITGPGGPYGLNPGQVTGYTGLFTAFQNAYNLSSQNLTRTPGTIAAKNTVKDNLINGTNGIRELVAIIQANPATTNQQREDLQITVPDAQPSPAPIPEIGPGLSVLSTLGRTAKIRLSDIENPDSRAKPDGVFGATIFYFVGAEAPNDPTEWLFLVNSTRTLIEIEFPLSIASGARVWLTAFWVNTRGESSPASAESISVRVGDMMSQVA